MKMDLANFTIDMMRPTIIAEGVEYQKKKFAEFLSIQEGWYTFNWFLALTLMLMIIMINQPGHEADHSPPSSAEVKNHGAMHPFCHMS
jgi:hypothetical protein